MLLLLRTLGYRAVSDGDVVPDIRLRRVDTRRLAWSKYHGTVSKIVSDLEPVATADQLRKARRQLTDLAGRQELSDLRVAKDGTLLLHVDRDLGYRPVIKFVTQATRLLGAVPRVVVDSAPGAGRYATRRL